MAAAWRGAWRSPVVTSASRGGGGGDPVLPPPQPALFDHSYDDNCGASSIASGTTLSMSNTATTYATSAAASIPFPFTAAGDGVTDEEKATMRVHIRDLIIRTATTGDGGGSSSALGRWLSELQVSWVLRLAQLDAASAGRTFVSRRLQHTARSWVLALHAISRCVASFTGWCSQQEVEEEEARQTWPPASEFVGFVAATFLLMLPFVDAVVALDDVVRPVSISSDDDHGHGGVVSGNKGAVASAHKFRALADVRDALYGVSEQVQLWHSCLGFSSSACSSPADAEAAARISAEMIRLLLAKLDKVDEAMRNTRDCIRTHFMSLTTTDDHGHGHPVSGLDPSPDIHVATQFAVSYIIVLSTSSSSSSNTSPCLGEENNTSSSSTNLNTVIIRSLGESLTRVSQSFADQSLRFLFLANNFYFLWHQLLSQNLLSGVPTDALARKIDSYIDSYLQVSWTPVLKPLHSHSPCCFFFTRYSSAQQRKFLTEFDKTYVAQKLWKVPDPELRRVLRTTIVDRVISVFINFLEDGGVSASRVVVSPESLQEMLEELFEG
ncbi:uncharacterized protein LOC120648539 [Panicum virgatum]|uniref:Exocyst subunit Exo70 family protein n=1 Tax=Panicum virgatum TaxID=38727 RepID=A0A8T0NEQ6_PANVG|nr:uncharacterized protein LOC120648539 [Panicum virgatum]KAG2547348.1 hypothetical protein PVAP13_9KG080200 [Panicum virgatum]